MMIYLLMRGAGRMEIDYTLIGQRIKEARKKKGWSQEKISEEIDVAVAYISRVERGNPINLKRLAQISHALDVPMEYLVTGVSLKSENYLNKELSDIVAQCSPEKQKLIYNIAKTILANTVKR